MCPPPPPHQSELHINESSSVIESTSSFIVYSPFWLPIWNYLIFPTIILWFLRIPSQKKGGVYFFQRLWWLGEKKTFSSFIFIYSELYRHFPRHDDHGWSSSQCIFPIGSQSSWHARTHSHLNKYVQFHMGRGVSWSKAEIQWSYSLVSRAVCLQ